MDAASRGLRALAQYLGCAVVAGHHSNAEGGRTRGTDHLYMRCGAYVQATKGAIPKAQSDARHPLTAAEVGALATQVQLACGLALRFAAWSGLRAGEIAGLRVQALDPLRHEVRVEETVIRLVGGRWQGGTPKSASSRRRLPVPPSLMREMTDCVAARGLAPDAYVSPIRDRRPEQGNRARGLHTRRLPPSLEPSCRYTAPDYIRTCHV